MQDAESTTTNQHKQYQCRHIFTDGRRCSSPCLRHEEFCYYHHTTRKPVANPKQRRNRRSTFHLPLPEDRSAIQSSIGQVLQRIASNDIDPRRAALLLYGLQIASLNLPKIQTLAKPAAEPQTVEEITIDPTLGILAPRTEVSEIAKRKSPVAQLIERMMQSEETAPTPEPATIPTLQATADNLHSTHTVKPRQLSFRPERGAEPLSFRPERSAVEKSASLPQLSPNRIPPLPLRVLLHSAQRMSFRPKRSAKPLSFRPERSVVEKSASLPQLSHKPHLASSSQPCRRSVVALVVSHARQHAAHIRKAGDHTRHRIVGVNLILEVDKSLVVGRDEGLEDLAERHNSVTHGDLALFALEAGQVLHMHVVQPRPHLVDGLDHIDARTHRMPDVDAAADAGVVLLHPLQNVQRGVPQLVLRSMIMDRNADVVLLHELFDPRKGLRSRVSGDDDG